MNNISRKLITSLLLIIFSLIYSMNIQAIEYPYFASTERASQIRNQFVKIKEGMSPTEVKEIMGDPDEIRDSFKSIKKSSPKTGYTYWYLIQRKVEHGSVLERDEKLVRISFNLNDRVTYINHWGFDIETADNKAME